MSAIRNFDNQSTNSCRERGCVRGEGISRSSFEPASVLRLVPHPYTAALRAIALVWLCFFSSQVSAATHLVVMRNFSFTPANLTINLGDTVTWTNALGQHDTVCGTSCTSNGVWKSQLLNFRGTFSRVFNQPGSFPYFCTPHCSLGMIGSITVIAPNTPPTISISSPENGQNFSAPANVTVQANASDADGNVAQVEFFLNGNSIGTSGFPYQASANNLGPGGYTFTALVTDNEGARASNSVSVTVTGAGPTITSAPESQLVTSGSDATFTVEASGTQPIFYQWFFDQSPIDGATGTSLTLTNVSTNASGIYTIGVANEFGSNFASATLTVTNIITGTPPTILEQPERQTAQLGSNATFTVSALGSAPLSYQWFVLNEAIPDATNTTLNLVNIIRQDSESYRVVISNDFGAVTSDWASLCIDYGEGCIFSLSSSNASFKSTGGKGSFNILASGSPLEGVLCPAQPSEPPSPPKPSLARSQAPLAPDQTVAGLPQIDCTWNGQFTSTNSWIVAQAKTNSGIEFIVLPNINSTPRIGIITVEEISFTITQSGATYGKDSDFNFDGHADFLFQHRDGRLAVWMMNGTTNVGSVILRNGKPATLGWQVVASHDFSNDGKTDILWQNGNGSLAIWFMDGTNFVHSEILSGTPVLKPVWRFAGLGDFTGDNKADFLFRHDQGYLLLWQMNGKKFVRQELIFDGDAVPPAWKITSVADFSGDKKPDVLWNNGSGSLLLWTMSGKAVISGRLLSNLPPITNARVSGLNDINQDGSVDLILRHKDGHLSAWYLNKTNRIGTSQINGGRPVAAEWTLVTPQN